MRETTREFIKGRINNSTVRPSVSNMTLSFISQPLRQGKSLYVPVSSSTYLPFSCLSFSPLFLSLLLSLISNRRGRNQISRFSIFILPTWTIIIALHVFALRFSNTNRYGRHDSHKRDYNSFFSFRS